MEAVTQDLRCKERPLQSRLSKKRFDEIRDELVAASVPVDIIQTTLAVICKVLKFDPDDRSMSKRQMEYVKRKANELGVSTYAVSTAKKAYYERKRAAKNEQAM